MRREGEAARRSVGAGHARPTALVFGPPKRYGRERHGIREDVLKRRVGRQFHVRGEGAQARQKRVAMRGGEEQHASAAKRAVADRLNGDVLGRSPMARAEASLM